jgi:hypothetical protein
LQLRSPATIFLKFTSFIEPNNRNRRSFPSAASNGDWRVERPTTTRTKKGFGAKKTADEEKPSQTFQRFNIGGFALGCTGRLPHATKKKKKKKKRLCMKNARTLFPCLLAFRICSLLALILVGTVSYPESDLEVETTTSVVQRHFH